MQSFQIFEIVRRVAMRSHAGISSVVRLLLPAAVAIVLLAPNAYAQLPAPEQGAPASPAATFNLENNREHISLLDGLWRFHTGDDTLWAVPAFDDSNWFLIRPDQGWNEQGYKIYGGLAWYRAKILVPEGEPPLSLYLPRVLSAYQLFVDGKLIATFGEMPPHARANNSSVPHIYELPRLVSRQAQTLTIAIRVWHSPYWARYVSGGLLGDIRVGENQLIQERSTLESHDRAWSQVDGIFLAMLESLAGLAALALFILRPQEKEYLWFGIWLAFSAAIRCLFVYTMFHFLGQAVHDLIWQSLFLVATLASIAFYFRLLHGKRDWLFWSAVGATLANIFLLTAGLLELISLTLWIEIGTALTLPVSVWIIVLLIQRVRQGLPDARLLLAPVLLQQLVAFIVRTLNLGMLTGWYQIPSGWLYKTSQWPFPFTLTDVADALFLLAMLAILIHRFTRTRRQEESYGREREAARTVQQVIVPEAVPDTPGFAIASIYKPAGEVGGDFFQILPIKNGGVLVVIGDVSGKGMPAAMTVSLLVGTVRTLAHYTSQPGEILAAMNKRMLARSNGGFTTCLVLRADIDGTLTIANAGHISPYRNGVELELENGLPLGLATAATYPESVFQSGENEQLTLVTDGVVEARSKSRELFGFERTQALSRQSAESIALAAQDFGQDDDITVVTISRMPAHSPVPVPAFAR